MRSLSFFFSFFFSPLPSITRLFLSTQSRVTKALLKLRYIMSVFTINCFINAGKEWLFPVDTCLRKQPFEIHPVHQFISFPLSLHLVVGFFALGSGRMSEVSVRKVLLWFQCCHLMTEAVIWQVIQYISQLKCCLTASAMKQLSLKRLLSLM